MFTVTDSVQNTGRHAGHAVALRHRSRATACRKLQNIFVVHEGAIQRIDGELTETDYADMTEFEVDAREGASRRR